MVLLVIHKYIYIYYVDWIYFPFSIDGRDTTRHKLMRAVTMLTDCLYAQRARPHTGTVSGNWRWFTKTDWFFSFFFLSQCIEQYVLIYSSSRISVESFLRSFFLYDNSTFMLTAEPLVPQRIVPFFSNDSLSFYRSHTRRTQTVVPEATKPF